jgi:CheY-like chemotaxis protein
MPARILIIDDEQDVRTYLRTLFQKEGYAVDAAGNGDEGLERVRAHRPDLVVLDIMMPRKSGLSFYRKLRNEASMQSVPVVVVSGVSQGQAIFEEELEGLPSPQAFVEKPIQPADFLELVRTLTA